MAGSTQETSLEAKQAVASAGIRLLRPKVGSEFLISDAPVIVSAVPGQRNGITSGIPIGNAFEPDVPLGRKLAVVIDMRNSRHSCVEIMGAMDFLITASSSLRSLSLSGTAEARRPAFFLVNIIWRTPWIKWNDPWCAPDWSSLFPCSIIARS